MAVSTVDEYLSALEKSKLLRSEQLVEAQRLAGESSDAAALARALARDNLVSRWQAGTLLALGQRAQLRLGKYKLIQRLGKGGMGTVFLAEHVTMNRRVALKIVPRAIAEDRASLDRFFAEARAIAALDHPNIVQAYSVDNEMDRYFIVMEFVDGQDLQQMLDLSGPMAFDQAANYIRQAAEGLAHAHARNLVHCDIKPSNLLVNNQGVIKILDLGLARLNQSDEPRGAAAGEPAFGTIDYMAPEQAMETANFDHRADIYSLGCTLYCLLTGHPPFPDGTLAQRLVKHQTQEPRDILLERPGTPQKLVDICKRMMAKEPENRYQSIAEVSAALAPLQNGSSGSAAVRVPQAVKPLDDVISVAAGAEDLFSFLTTSPKSKSSSNGAKTLASAATVAKPAKPQKKKVQAGGTFAAALAGVWAKRSWLINTTKGKIVAAVGGTLLLATVAGLASLPFLLSGPNPVPKKAIQAKEDKKGLLDEHPGSMSDLTAERKLDVSHSLLDQNVPEKKIEPEKPKHSEVKPQTAPPPKSEKPANPPPKPPVAPASKPAQSEKKPDPPVAPVEVAKPISLDGLSAAVDLPLPGKGANDAVSLGKLDLHPKTAIAIELLGGETVAKNSAQFELQKSGDASLSGWSMRMTEKNKDSVTIARIWPEQGEVKIRWTDEAKDKATLARYCALQFTSEQKTHIVNLVTSKSVPPLVIDVDTGFARDRMSRDFPLPDASTLRLQILPLDKSLPKSEIKIMDAKGHAARSVRGKPIEPTPGDTVPFKGRAIVLLKKDKTPRIGLVIAFDARGKEVTLDMLAACEFSSGRKVPFNVSSLQEVNAEVGAFLMASETANQNKNARKAPAEQVQAAKMAKDELKALGDLVEELNQKASIPFRIYAVLGEGEAAAKVVIFQSGQMVEKAKPAGPKKNLKGNKKKGASPDVDELKL